MERQTNPDKIRFLVISKGSITELKTQTQIGLEIALINEDSGKVWLTQPK